MSHQLSVIGTGVIGNGWPSLERLGLAEDGVATTDELIDRVVEGCEYQAAGRLVSELDRRRDNFLVELLALTQKYWPEAEGLEGCI